MLVKNKRCLLNKGGRHADERGTIFFFNDFDMTEVKRFYRINHPHTSVVRGWRGHKIEQRWFHVCVGIFEIKIVEIDNWDSPNPDVQSTAIILSAEQDEVLYIAKGYATSFKALTPNSEMIVFADFSIEHAKNDDYIFPADYFKG